MPSIILVLLSAMNMGVGAKMGFSGGPSIALLGSVKLNNRVSINASVGGFPGIIMMSEVNARYHFSNKTWSPFAQGGFGIIRFFRGRGEGKNIKEFHVCGGILWSHASSLEFGADLGLMYGPFSLNPWIEEEFPDLLIFICPILRIEAVYYF